MLMSTLCKYVYITVFTLCVPLITLGKTAESNTDPFVVVMVIKNEESKICQALEQYVHAGMHSFLIYDVYSTDNTVEVLESYFRQHAIRHGHIIQGPFDGARDTQNHALELAEAYFPDATFLLIGSMDLKIDWELYNLTKLQEFCREEKNTENNSYSMLHYQRDLENYEIVAYRTFLIRAHEQVRFEGRKHCWEYIIADAKVPLDIYFTRQLPYVFPFKDIFI